MKRKNKKFQKKSSKSLNRLSLFQKNDGKFSKKCPLSVKDAPLVDYKNISGGADRKPSDLSSGQEKL